MNNGLFFGSQVWSYTQVWLYQAKKKILELPINSLETQNDYSQNGSKYSFFDILWGLPQKNVCKISKPWSRVVLHAKGRVVGLHVWQGWIVKVQSKVLEQITWNDLRFETILSQSWLKLKTKMESLVGPFRPMHLCGTLFLLLCARTSGSQPWKFNIPN